jgi:hypothetical protein
MDWNAPNAHAARILREIATGFDFMVFNKYGV